MKLAVLQSNYIPWKGYFDIIHDVDMFLFYDEVQYTKNDWRNRNQILTDAGLKWLTIPCGYDINRKICEVKIKNEFDWQKQHYNLIKHCYSKAPFYKKYEDFLNYVYLEKEWNYLYELNRFIIKTISTEFLGIKVQFADSRDYPTLGSGHEKLLSLVKATGADTYISGPAAKNYITVEDYENSGIKLIWKDYSSYPEYKQLHEPFYHNVSILDLLFNTGQNANNYIWGWRYE